MINLFVLSLLILIPLVITGILSTIGVNAKHLMMFVAATFITMLGGSFILALL